MSLEKTIIEELEGKLKAWKPGASERSVGTVEKIADGIARISGLPEAMAGELLHIETPEGPVPAMVLNLEEAMIGAVTLGSFAHIKAGQTVIGTGTVATVPVGPELVGRVVNALGVPIDGKGAVKTKEAFPLEHIAPGVITRQAVTQPLQTGIKAIDAMIPIGRGQRELIIGDRGTGKTAVAIDTMIAQKNTGVVSIYVAIGQKESKIARLRAQLEKHGVLNNTIIVVAGASDPAPMQYLAPYAGAAMGEWFMQNGRDALIIYDDLSKHAAAYREISLLLRRPPGREAYPGDVFYLHSRLLERSARVNKENGGGSLTALPIIETQAGDISAYIPTNVISITDGQIFLETDLFYQGVRPAINTGLSVSRVGGSAQIKAMRKVAGQMRLELAQYRELAAFAQFGSELDEATQSQIEKGRRLTELLKQPQYDPVPVAEQVVLLYAGTRGFFSPVEPKHVQECASYIREQIGLSHEDITKDIAESGLISEETEEKLKKVLTDIVKDFRPANA